MHMYSFKQLYCIFNEIASQSQQQMRLGHLEDDIRNLKRDISNLREEDHHIKNKMIDMNR